MILLVEDDATADMRLLDCYEGKATEVVEAGDGNEAVALLAGLAIDLVITDMVLPKINGLHLVSLISRPDGLGFR